MHERDRDRIETPRRSLPWIGGRWIAESLALAAAYALLGGLAWEAPRSPGPASVWSPALYTFASLLALGVVLIRGERLALGVWLGAFALACFTSERASFGVEGDGLPIASLGFAFGSASLTTLAVFLAAYLRRGSADLASLVGARWPESGRTPEWEQTHSRFQAIMDASTQTSIIATDVRGLITVFNAGAERMLGYTAAEMVGKKTPEVIHLAEEIEGHGRILAASLGYEVKGFEVFVELARRGGHDEREWTYVTKQGQRLTVNLTVTSQRDARGRIIGYLGVAVDISASKRAERALHESRDRLELALRNASHGIWQWDIVSGQVALDDHWHSLQGYRPNEAPAQVESWRRSIHPDDRREVFAALERHLKLPDQPFDVQYRCQRKSGDWIWINSRGRVDRWGDDGQPIRMTGTIHDISDRKLSELLLTSRAEELARSNAELEQFAYVASHDLREPLRMVQSFCGLLRDRYRGRLDERADKYIELAVDGAQRMQLLIDDLLEFARVGRSNERRGPVELNEVLGRALANLQVAIDESNARIEATPLPRVEGDEFRLIQLFQNLIGNAIKFRGVDPPQVQIEAEQEGGEWRIAIRDNGIGVAPQHFSRLFTLFQRLHAREDYPGTGIGLALCKRIVEMHGGRIGIESQVGQGTTIHFHLRAEPGVSRSATLVEADAPLEEAVA